MASQTLGRLRRALSEAQLYTSGELSEAEIDRLSAYYEFALKWNQLLHLTTIVEPEEFVRRHIFESMIGERCLVGSVSKVWDVGSGLGVPGIPIAIRRPHLAVILIESSLKKTVFLKELVEGLSLSNVVVLHGRFEDVEIAPGGACLTSRALEKMEKAIVKIIGKAPGADQFLFFVGKRLKAQLERQPPAGYRASFIPLPLADRHVLVSLVRST